MDFFNLRKFIPFACILIFLDFFIELLRSSSIEEMLLSLLIAILLSPVIYIIWNLLYKKYKEIKEDIEYRW